MHAAGDLLRRCLYGVDLLPQAVEIAKLALWLRSAEKGEPVADLGANLISGDSLAVADVFERLHSEDGLFDLVIGNPPWGAEISAQVYRQTCDRLDLQLSPRWDSWELFVVLGLSMLRDGGTLALVLPDTFFSPEKARLREILLTQTQLERAHSLGPDWFGPQVRMSTIVVHARKGTPLIYNDFSSLMLTGQVRRAAIRGEVPLSQIEARLGRTIPADRCLSSQSSDIEVFRSREDDQIMEIINLGSVTLEDLCDHGRGEEMSSCPDLLSTVTRCLSNVWGDGEIVRPPRIHCSCSVL